MPDMTERSEVRPGRRKTAASSTAVRAATRQVKTAGTARLTPDDRFFRHIVSSMRNGVIAFRRDGTLALMNDDAYRIFGLRAAPGDVGRPFADVLRERPEVIRVFSSAFELSYLPNRAELRLKDLHRVIGYTLVAAVTVAMVSGNVGTLVRHRGLAIPFMVWLSAVGACELIARARHRGERMAAITAHSFAR